jgi:uncharacterized CHY-type Zn-finger protein
MRFLGCIHYHGPLDIVSIKFKCCLSYFSCYACHLGAADHPAKRWKPDEFDTKAVLCRKCDKELTIHQYLSCNNRCLNCGSPFNPGCKNHWELYFETP